MGTKKARDSELAGLTVSVLLSLAYLLAICWVFPVIPMAIVSALGLPWTDFPVLWLGGSLFTGLAFYYYSKKRK